MSATRREGTRIAVVGMACRFPGANDADAFWRNLRDGIEADASLTVEEWAETIGMPVQIMDLPGIVTARPRVEDAEKFDAAFFGYTPREAQGLDPQQRLFLECAWESLENAGYDCAKYEGAIGVCAGVSQSSYLMNLLQWDKDLVSSLGSLNVGIGNMNDSLATRVAYKLDLKGPAYAVQCFCSTSLVAVHLASQVLSLGEADMMLAGGSTVVVPQTVGYMYQEGGILSPDGHTRTFDAKGQGMVFGNGVGVVVLKRLEDAVADGDRIRAVILGSATNNDGSLKVGYTAPSVSGQARVIEQALDVSGVDPESIGYVEAHGTATSLGDPAEIAGITKAYRKWTDKVGYCAIGSVKTNIGHLDAAAGVAGFMKAVLALENKKIPASLHFESPNPQIDFDSSPFFVNTELREWPVNGLPRRAGVSSFGFGGTNAHVILEEAPAARESDPARPWQLLLLSAKTARALDNQTRNLGEHLAAQPEANLADVAHTLQLGRHVFNHRRAVVARDVEDAKEALADESRWQSEVQERQHAPVAFMFTGQGSQYVGMAKGLYASEPPFREALDECFELLQSKHGVNLRDVIYPAAGAETERSIGALEQTELAQPALFAVEYAAARLLMSLGIEPAAMIGHSIGEYVAAHLSGVFSLEAALGVVAERGRLMQSLPRGSMLAVPLSEEGVERYVSDAVSLASLNSPAASVLSGPTPAIEELERELTEHGVMSRRLHTSHAFHSSMMEPIRDRFREMLEAVEMQPPRVPFVSNVTGRWITDEEAVSPGYWDEHLRRPVRFYQGLETLLHDGSTVLVEVGPGTTLSSLSRQLAPSGARPKVVSTIRHPKEARDDRAVLLDALARLWLAGAEIDWAGLHRSERRSRVPLPTYPFEREKFWVEKNQDLARANEIVAGQTLRRQAIEDWYYQPSWERYDSARLEPSSARGESSWLVFEDELGLGAALIDELRKSGRFAVSVRPGDVAEPGGSSDAGFVIRPAERSDYLDLLEKLAGEGKTPTHVAHLWGVTPREEGRSLEERLAESQQRGFESVLFFAQALARAGVQSRIELAVVTSGLHDVVGTEALRPEKATVLGLVRVVPQELRNVTAWNIDIDVDAGTEASSAGAWDEHARRILAEFDEPVDKGRAPLVAFRGPHRWIGLLEPSRLRSVDALPLREEGVYLVTGGLGGIGLVLAKYLASRWKAKLVLTGRTPLPPREVWTDPEHASDRRIEKLRELEAAGGEVLYVAADVSRSEDMAGAVRRARERFGPIEGAIHSAGVPGGGIIQLKEPAEAARVMAPKVAGTIALEAALRDEPLTFLALCSSTAAWMGGVGQVDYCAANCFLDAYAQSLRGRNGRYTVSINWDTWKEVGMAVETEITGALRALRELNLKLGISPREGVEAFERVLASGLPEVGVVPVDMTPALLQPRLSRPKKASTNASEAAAGSEAAAAAREETSFEGKNDMERIVHSVWKKVLGAENVSVNDNFFERGGDSLTALQVLSLLKGRIQREIPITLFYEAPTIALLAKALEPRTSTSAEPVEENLAEVEKRAETRLALMRDRRRRGRGAGGGPGPTSTVMEG